MGLTNLKNMRREKLSGSTGDPKSLSINDLTKML
jgi:hypothetical protein